MKKNKKGMDTMDNSLNNTSCNSCDVNIGMDKSIYEMDGDLDKTLARVANVEAGTDISFSGNALTQEAAVNSGLGAIGGVTDDVMYHNIADYTMIDIEDGNIQNNQGS